MKKKAVGFFATIIAAVLSAAAGITYAVTFSGISYKEQVYDVKVVVILIAAAVVALVLLFVNDKLAGLAPAVLCACSGISFMMFISMVIWPISDTIYGIEPFPQFTELVVCAVLLVVTLVFSEISLYMKKYKAA